MRDTSVFLKKLKVNNFPMGDNSPNLVTLKMDKSLKGIKLVGSVASYYSGLA
jgi:hypothetical protein